MPRNRKGEFDPQVLKKNQTGISQDISGGQIVKKAVYIAIGVGNEAAVLGTIFMGKQT